MKKVSVVFPAYNEEESIESCVVNAYNALSKIAEDFEIIVVNDGSSDRTTSICEELRSRLGKIKVITKQKNEGYGHALRDGFNNAYFDLVFFCDADNQFDLNDIEGLLEFAPDYDMVIGYRKTRHDSLKRKIFSWGYNNVIKLLFGLAVKDINCAFKLFRKELFTKINIESQSYLVNAEILVKGLTLGYTIKEVPVTHLPRVKGISKVSSQDIPKTIQGIVRLYRSRKEWLKK